MFGSGYSALSGVTPDEDNSIVGDPLFEDAGSGDFRVQSGSPGENQGVDLSISIDKDYVAVPATPDMGAYEIV